MKKYLLILIIILISLNMVACSYKQTQSTDIILSENLLKVHFVDVGQGDCTFIELPDKKCMLIDSGEYEYAQTVTGYIKNLGYTTLDYVVATHPHTDHMGCMATVINEFSVSRFYMPEAAHDTVAFDKMLDAVADSGCDAEYAQAGKNIFDYEDVKADFIAPHGTNYVDLNNASAVVKLSYKDASFIFTGDAEEKSENQILASKADISADVLKCGHHGSSSSTTERFLEKVNPKYAVIMCGEGNSYGHPHIETLALLEHKNIEYYRTDEDGTIIISTDGVNFAVEKIKTEIKPNAPNIADNSDTKNEIYRTKSGKRYHRDGCDSLSYTKIPTTKAEAERLGLTPCKACRP